MQHYSHLTPHEQLQQHLKRARADLELARYQAEFFASSSKEELARKYTDEADQLERVVAVLADSVRADGDVHLPDELPVTSALAYDYFRVAPYVRLE